MFIFRVERGVGRRSSAQLPGGANLDWTRVCQVLDREGVPDGYPFVIEKNGSFDGCLFLNQYLFEALLQGGLDVRSMSRFHVYNLSRCLRFIRNQHAHALAEEAGVPAADWVQSMGLPLDDLTTVTREDLLAYRNARKVVVKNSTLKTELGCITAFIGHALARGWIKKDPVPRWGAAKRSTLSPRTHQVRKEKFVPPTVLRDFLQLGLRQDGSEFRSSGAERDYTFGLLLSCTGLRREEAAFLLDAEIASPGELASDGLHRFTRVGKMGYPRRVYVARSVINQIDLYRRSFREAAIEAAQPSLWERYRAGKLVEYKLIPDASGCDQWHDATGACVEVESITNEDRARAVHITDDGQIRPLGLFVTRHGLPAALRYWNEIFADARKRFWRTQASPPTHVKITPHTLRHSFAVLMLSRLMHDHQLRSGDPYEFLVQPLGVIKELLGHGSIETTYQYLYVAEQWGKEVPSALIDIASALDRDGTYGSYSPSPDGIGAEA